MQRRSTDKDLALESYRSQVENLKQDLASRPAGSGAVAQATSGGPAPADVATLQQEKSFLMSRVNELRQEETDLTGRCSHLETELQIQLEKVEFLEDQIITLQE